MRFFKVIFPLTLLACAAMLAIWQFAWGNSSSSTIASQGLIIMLALQTGILLSERFDFLRFSSLLPPPSPINKSTQLKSSDDASTSEDILEALAGGILTVNEHGRILYINQSAKTLLACENAVGQPVEQVLQMEDAEGNALVSRILSLHSPNSRRLLQFGQVRLISHTQDTHVVDLHTTYLHDQGNTIVFIFRDVTTDRKVINRLYQQASHDALTGLMNRRSFEEYLEQVAHENDQNKSHVMVSIDLDNFKIVNDTCGHQAGDELLRQVSHILQRSVRQTDKVARMGGDEFAILLESCVTEKGRKLMDSILIKLRNYRFSWEGKVFAITASMGLVEFTPSPELSLKTLFADVDRACYTAKALGRNQTFVHINTLEVVEADQFGTDWAGLLDRAVTEDRFILFVQPIIPLQDQISEYVHYEVLLRLPFRKHLLSPGSFLPAADRLDMMGKIDRWIIRRVLETLSANTLSTESGADIRLMINLSSQAVQDNELGAYIAEQINTYKVNPTLLCFEIAESVAIANFVQTKRLMKALHDMGCHLVLDDFGSGFSSLNYVRDLPLSYLKIDGNFVHNLVSNPIDAAMVKAVHEVGQVMQLSTIAELVEDSETLERLRQIGVDYAQGYFCGKPYPFHQLGLESRTKKENISSSDF
ncbi:putative bifunctional diguanylate cyclase/phosphodiesterase [Thiolinea disciformis]|uniref:putative bifunctional diguanylate cyclase/phosphodiesterase n=1 Tax=Thiolinea disciformis TaxID=125614 RepID=UPI00036BE4B8|nr:EAL domain-containing protein [Thiolinea disciformis]